jgi:hypothetical protein
MQSEPAGEKLEAVAGHLSLRVIVQTIASGLAPTGSTQSGVIHRSSDIAQLPPQILPTGVIGNDSRNTMCLGTL